MHPGSRPLRHRVMVLTCLVLVLASCERSRPSAAPQRPPQSTEVESTSVSAAPPVSTHWDSSAGPVLLARGTSASNAYVIFPEYDDSTMPDTLQLDASPLRGDVVQLVSRAGTLDSVSVTSAGTKVWAGDDCIEWPTATLAVAGDSARAAGWTVGFVQQHVTSMPLDSLAGLPSADSARLAADLTRLASALPDDTSQTFRGIPFSVRYAFRFEPASGVSAVIADLVQRLNQEASPLEQHTILIAERSTATLDAPYRVVYHERTGGSEESIETMDVLTGVRFASPSRAALVVFREGPDTGAYALLERRADGQWRIQWTSVHTGC